MKSKIITSPKNKLYEIDKGNDNEQYCGRK